MKIVYYIVIALAGLLALGWLGLKIKPAPFPAYPAQTPELETIPLPAGLPAPVERFYRVTYGDRIPVITSAIMSGRAVVRPFGLWMPARFVFIHDAGQHYRHYIEATFFGIPIMKVNERYVDGVAVGETPGGVEQGPKVDQAANLGLWAETMSFPAVFLTDARVRWEPVDAESALLVVPFEDTEEHFIVRFDPETGLARNMEVMRYRASNSPAKSLWIPANEEYAVVDGQLTTRVGSATWLEMGGPWAYFTTDKLILNADVQEYVRARGY
jgi:hypothetical protein